MQQRIFYLTSALQYATTNYNLNKHKGYYMQNTTKLPYYKKTVTTLAQLQKNCVRIAYDSRQGSSTKAANIAAMFKSYAENNVN